MKTKSVVPFLAMLVAQVAHVGLTLAAKEAIETGMNNFSYAFYSNAIASLLLPAAFLIHRSPNHPKLTLSAADGFLLLGILGFLLQVAGYVGITYASVTEATAILNLIPGFTFVFAIIFRVERLGHGGLAKSIGTLVTIVGAITVTLFTGPAIISPNLTSLAPQHRYLLGQQSSNFVLGGLLMLINALLAALFIVTQALILKKYSAVLIVMLAYSLFVAVFSLLASLILEHDLNEFSLQPKMRLFAILYAGFFGGGFQLTIASWCMKMKGPVFVAIFQPLGIIIATIAGVLFFGDGLYLGCLIGSAVILIGFYCVIWGNAKEDRIAEANMVNSSNSPLLQDDIEVHNVGIILRDQNANVSC